MDWNKYLAKAYKALDNAHLHFNVEGGTFDFDNDRDARQGATILGRLYGFDNVIQSGFNVILSLPEDVDENLIKSLIITEESKLEIVELHYDKLPIKVWHKVSNATETSPEDWDYEETYTDWIYKVDKDNIKYDLYGIISDKQEYKDFSDEELNKYVDDNFDTLLDKYNKEVLDLNKDSAIKDYEENHLNDKKELEEDMNRHGMMFVDYLDEKMDRETWRKEFAPVLHNLQDNHVEFTHSGIGSGYIEEIFDTYFDFSVKYPKQIIRYHVCWGSTRNGMWVKVSEINGEKASASAVDKLIITFTEESVDEDLDKDIEKELEKVFASNHHATKLDYYKALLDKGFKGKEIEKFINHFIDEKSLYQYDDEILFRDKAVENAELALYKASTPYALVMAWNKIQSLRELGKIDKETLDRLTQLYNEKDKKIMLGENIDELIYKVAERLKNNINSFEDELITLSQIEGVDVEEIKQREPMQIAKALVEEGIVDSRMFEDIEKHDTLNPKLFEGNELKEDVKDALLKVVDAFVEDLKDSEVDIKVKDAVIIGSNVNYNYTKDSDIDLHIIADSQESMYPGDVLTLLYSAYRSIFNKNYDITIKGIPCEVYVELDEVHGISNGIYSLYNGWLKEPEQKNVPNLDKEAFDKLFDEWEDKYFALLDEIGITPEEMLALNEVEDDKNSSEKVYDFIEDIYELRKESIANEGEFGLGNLVFKEFRNLGYLDALKALTKILKGKELSLENMNEDFSQDTLQSIYDYTLDNNGGTFDLRTGKSLVGDDKVKNIYSVEFKSKDWNKRVGQVDKQEVLNAIETLLRSDSVKDADAIGTWSSEENERPQSSVGLDKFFKDREEAEKFALEHKQKAIGVFNANGEYSDTIYKKDFKYKPHKEETPKEEPNEQDKENK